MRKAQYTAALPVYVTFDVRDRIEDIAEREDLSMAQVIREILDLGLVAREEHRVQLTPEEIASLPDHTPPPRRIRPRR